MKNEYLIVLLFSLLLVMACSSTSQTRVIVGKEANPQVISNINQVETIEPAATILEIKSNNSQPTETVYPQYATRPEPSTDYYINAYGQEVQSPTYYPYIPEGATALCRDGTYSFSQTRRGTCSHHGGVERWL